MCKTELIDAIRRINTSARPDFLAEFSLDELDEYLHKLASVRESGESPRGAEVLQTA